MKQKVWCNILGVILTVFIIVTASGCRDVKNDDSFVPKLDKSQSCSIKVYGSYSNFEALESEFDRFNEYYPNVELSYIYLDGYGDSIGNSLLSQEAPDIYCTFYWMWGNPSCSDIFESAADLAKEDTGIDFSCVRESLIRKTEDGQVLMAPVLATSFGMLVNIDLFEKEGINVPVTWNDFENICKELKEKGYSSPMMGYVSSSSGSFEYNFGYPSLVNAIIAEPSMRDGFNELDSQSGKVMRPCLEKIKKLVDSGYIDVSKCTNEISDNYDAAIMRFFEGDVPMLVCSADVASGTKKRESQSDKFLASPFEYKFYPVPFDDKGGFVIDTVAMNFSVNKNSPNKDMAMEFMRFLISNKELGNMASVKRLITTSKDLSLDSIYSALGNTPSERVICSTKAGINDNAVKQFRYAAHHVLLGDMTVDEAIEKFGKLKE
ncbi:ABC transporter substrate-binding protein [Butyrivibrio sp. NC3005]|uniref:ABC transporter substrate-binding protein n=1 Tax=Butyrivibrio sp. NC3005 TaxID=1280685 RepID=UPI00041D019F|nr:ABC transporter substrate-binding protein [Butyrivibrio sp. NC3005]